MCITFPNYFILFYYITDSPNDVLFSLPLKGEKIFLHALLIQVNFFVCCPQ